MKKLYDDVECKVNKNLRGGIGEVITRYYLNENTSKLRFSALNFNEMEPNATIGEHTHNGEDEFYLIVEGRGIAILNGEKFEVNTGDGFMCYSGSSHGLMNTLTNKKLKFISVFFK